MLGHCSIAARKGSDDALTEQKSLNLHDETTARDQVQHSLFRAVVGKLQYITGVRPDLMFATKMLVIQTCVTNTCRFDTCQESETKWLEQDLETHHGIF